MDLKLDQFNVSNNLLNGSIPKSLEKFESDSFLGTSLCGKPLGVCSSEGIVPSQPISVGNIPGTLEGGKGKKKLSGGAIAGIVIGCVVGLFLILLVVMVLVKKKGSERTRAVGVASVKPNEGEIHGEKAAVVEAPENVGYGNEEVGVFRECD